MTKTFQIARRAYGEFTKIENFTGTWVDAVVHSMALQYANQDGEYSVFYADETIGHRPGSNYQSGMDWL